MFLINNAFEQTIRRLGYNNISATFSVGNCKTHITHDRATYRTFIVGCDDYVDIAIGINDILYIEFICVNGIGIFGYIILIRKYISEI